ncbi:hypothetical protein ACHQM5_026613 [Ranunculus cassubicifolius]
MFGSTNPFGQSSSSPFGSQPVFGQNNNAGNNPFAPKPFGTTTPFGSQTGGSIFGGTSTGVFGATQSSSPSPTFGVSSTPGFGSSTPAFGASSTPTFGSSSSSFGGSSTFGQTPAFGGGFGSTPNQTSPFGGTGQQTQSAFGSNPFGSSSTPFGASSQPAFGAQSTSTFGMTGTPAFGAPSTPAFGATNTPAFGSTSTSAFGSTGSAFGTSTTPTFGSGGAFGGASTPAFGANTTPAFGSSPSPLFGASTSAFNFNSSPAFGQSNSAFGSTPFGTTPTSPSPFGAQSSSFGSQATTPAFGSPTFGQSGFGGQQGGSRVVSYSPTVEADGGNNSQQAGKLESISAMPAYKEKSHEELRWEDYQKGDKGGPNPAGQPAAGGFGTPTSQPNPFGGGSTFGQSTSNPFSSTAPSNPFGANTSAFGTQTSNPFGGTATPSLSTPTSNPFGSTSTPNPFGAPTSSAPSMFGSTSGSPFGGSSTPSLFGTSSSLFGSTPSMFGSGSAPATTSAFGSNFGNTQSAPLFQSTTPSTFGQTSSPFGQTTPAFGQTSSAFGQTTPAFGQTSSAFGQTTPAFGQTTPAFGQTSSAFGQTTPAFGQTASAFGQSNLFSTPSTGFGFASSSTPSLTTTAQPAQTSGGFNFSNFGQTQAPSGFGGISGGFGQSTFGQQPQNTVAVQQQTAVPNPFGTLPAMPQMSIGRSGSSPSVQYGISSMPVTDKPSPVRVSSLLTSRHLSQRRVSLPSRKYHPKNDAPKVPFYCDDEEAASNPKADALFIPRENPRSLVIFSPSEKWPSRTTTTPVKSNGNTGKIVAENDKEEAQSNQRNGVEEDHFITLTGHRAGEAAIVYEHGADIEALMPKLQHADYYTEPRIQELAAKERAEPGFCQHVKDFVVGRHGYGSIKFMGETDVRGLDLESVVQFNDREVIVYMDDAKKPPVGEGLNKPAEVSLLNIKGFDKKTGQQFTEGKRVEKYKEMLKKKTEEQGAEFVSYDALKGEWKFRVKHFSRYCLEVEDDGE